jgi:hypothetical protein
MKTIILSIHNGGNGKYRFYVNSVDSRLIFKNRKQKVIIYVDGNKFETHTTCGPKDWNNLKIGSKKGYDLYSSEISKWIIKKGFHKKILGKCRTFYFTLKRIREYLILIKY